MLRKVRTNIPVQLGISIDRIEVEPLVAQKHVFWVSVQYWNRVSILGTNNFSTYEKSNKEERHGSLHLDDRIA